MIKSIVTTFAATTMLTGTAFAADSIEEHANEAMHMTKDAVSGVSINRIGEEGNVTISGKVAYIDVIDNEFTLEDETGKIDVEQAGDLDVNVGDSVTVSGTITSDLGEKEIAASKVTVTHKAHTKGDKS
jgi:hypothetical protein